MNNKTTELFRAVLQQEAEAISKIALDDHQNLDDIIQTLFDCKGKVIITGIGKSGHIGKKIAASLSSLGTPSFFMHATEGVHGDLGMVARKDVVIAISNSGETQEVLDLLPSLEVIGVKLIGIIGKYESTLAKSCDYVLYVGVRAEADLLGLAPTSSTTATLAVGDALAVLLSTKRRFTQQNFGLFHPGGSLGKALVGEGK